LIDVLVATGKSGRPHSPSLAPSSHEPSSLVTPYDDCSSIRGSPGCELVKLTLFDPLERSTFSTASLTLNKLLSTMTLSYAASFQSCTEQWFLIWDLFTHTKPTSYFFAQRT
jgi:hypothetical protein